MEQMLVWSMVYQELARRRPRPQRDDDFYRGAYDGDGSTTRLLRSIWPRFAGGR
jgi:hypothetical protein